MIVLIFLAHSPFSVNSYLSQSYSRKMANAPCWNVLLEFPAAMFPVSLRYEMFRKDDSTKWMYDWLQRRMPPGVG